MRVFLAACALLCAQAADLYVGPRGNDANPGSLGKPLATFDAARRAARNLNGPVNVYFRAGTYYLPSAVVFTRDDAAATYLSYPGERAVISGGMRLHLAWNPYRDGILQARVPQGTAMDQLFVNGERQHLARYPNYDPAARYFDGWSPDAFSKERAARWSNPRGGFIHAMHRALWGDFHYVITGKDASGNVTYEGGWQNNRPAPMHDKYRFVENIFEELDAPGEWFLDSKTSTLYFYPPKGLNLATTVLEAARLPHLLEFRGARRITLRDLTFRHAARTFMQTREPLLRSDWAIYRGGAILYEGAEDCAIVDSLLDQLGGNAVFVSKYNRRIAVRGTEIVNAGAGGVAFVGDPEAVRSPLFNYSLKQAFEKIDLTPGPKSEAYPADCVVEDTLIHRTGRFEKQTAPVHISMSQSIAVRHCSIYDVPRAGINIGDGTFGGHVIENCDIFDTVQETGDHGSFNSWGRDRYWALQGVDLNAITLGAQRQLPLLDAVKPSILRNNRWRCDHGWDIDLDDGSSNYEIYNNLALNGGIKLREGFYRRCENNVMVSNSFHPHVWYRNSQDVFRRNIVSAPYKPIRVEQPWGKECDYNLLHRAGAPTTPATGLQKQSGLDAHSLEGDAQFINPAQGDYRVKAGSPALTLGFQNFPMDQFGVQKPALRKLARTPKLPGATDSASATLTSTRDRRIAPWMGATVRNVSGLGEVSAAGLPGEVGVLLLEVPPQSQAAKSGLKRGDVILKLDYRSTETLKDLQDLTPQTGKFNITIFRDQAELPIAIAR